MDEKLEGAQAELMQKSFENNVDTKLQKNIS